MPASTEMQFGQDPPRSVGYPFKATQVRIIDPDNRPLPPGAEAGVVSATRESGRGGTSVTKVDGDGFQRWLDEDG